MTETEISILYEQHVDLMRKTVWDFMRRMNIPPHDFSELFSQSNLHFMLAVQSYNNERYKFSTWLRTQIWYNLMIERTKRQRELGIAEGMIDNMKGREDGYAHSSADFRNVDWGDELSRDAECLFRLVRRGGFDIAKMTRYRRNGLKSMFAFLRGHGWSRRRIHFCFKNLKRLVE